MVGSPEPEERENSESAEGRRRGGCELKAALWMVKRLLARTASERREAAGRKAPERAMRPMAFSAILDVLGCAVSVESRCGSRVEGGHDGRYF